MQILCGDIGGTKTRMAILKTDGDESVLVHEAEYVSSQYPSLDVIVRDYLERNPAAPDAAGFGIAGPVRDNRSTTTNLPWLIDGDAMSRELRLPRVVLSNDLEATAWGITGLSSGDVHELHPGTPDAEGNWSVIAAGTGLGEAGVSRRNGRFVPFATEGGHTDFAAATEREFALYQYLAQRYGHVSWERVVSGMGIVDILRFLCHYLSEETPDWLSADMKNGDAGATISAAADSGRCTLCEKTMDLFVRLYGREVGNHALKVMATGGVYIGGGIAPKILPRLQEPAFIDSFFAKGRMEPLMRSMPVKIILNDRAALLGAGIAVRAAMAG